MHFDTVTTRVPATSANLGPGFDCMGVALGIYSTVSLSRSDDTLIAVRGEGARAVPLDERNLVYRSVARFYDRIGKPVPDLRMRCINRIPLSRGLGSSAAAIVGGFSAANALEGSPLAQTQVFKACVEIEGHPDNVAPAIFGGFQLVAEDNDSLVRATLQAKRGLKAVLFIPQHPVVTTVARSVLPKKVPMKDSIYNASRASLLVHALALGRWDLLETATQDRLHQPYRTPLIPGLGVVFRAALDAGAHGVFLSGSGPTVLAFASGDAAPIVRSVTEAANRVGTYGTCRVVRLGTTGMKAATG